MRDLLAFYQQHLNLQTADFLKIDHEDAIVATVYKVSLSNGKQYILKVCERPNDYLCETYFLKHFEGKLPVPCIIDLIEPTPDTPGAILMEYIQGNLLNKFKLTENVIYEIGSLLAKIHLNKVSGFGDLTKQNQLSSDPTSYFIFKFEEGMEECSNHLSPSLLTKSRNYFNANINLLSSVDGPCIVHRDFRPGNILVNQDKIEGIIDWSSARGSFAEEDFTSLALNEWSDNANLKNMFLKGYSSVRVIPNYSVVVPLLLLSKAIATIGYTVKTKTWDNKNATLYQKHRQLLETIITRS